MVGTFWPSTTNLVSPSYCPSPNAIMNLSGFFLSFLPKLSPYFISNHSDDNRYKIFHFMYIRYFSETLPGLSRKFVTTAVRDWQGLATALLFTTNVIYNGIEGVNYCTRWYFFENEYRSYHGASTPPIFVRHYSSNSLSVSITYWHCVCVPILSPGPRHACTVDGWVCTYWYVE